MKSSNMFLPAADRATNIKAMRDMYIECVDSDRKLARKYEDKGDLDNSLLMLLRALEAQDNVDHFQSLLDAEEAESKMCPHCDSIHTGFMGDADGEQSEQWACYQCQNTFFTSLIHGHLTREQPIRSCYPKHP